MNKVSDPTRRRFERPIRFLQGRLSPEGYLGLHLTVGLLVILAAGWWFGDIAEDMSRNAATRQLDERVILWFQEQASPRLTLLARIVTAFGSVAFIAAGSIGSAVALMARHSFYRLLAVAFHGRRQPSEYSA